jgi:hypothetical protein
MNTLKRKLLLSALLLVAIFCLGLCAISTAGVWTAVLSPLSAARITPTLAFQALPPAATSVPAQTEEPGRSLTPTASAIPTEIPGDSGLPADITRQMDQIQKQVIQIRGLQPTGPVKRALLTHDQLQKNVVTDFLKYYSAQDAKNDVLVLSTFGLIQPGFDLYDFYQRLYAEQIAGYYDNQTKAMYVVKGENFLGPERMTYAHEYTHVLQDQNYDIQNGMGYSDERCKKETERCAGIQALIEGDATYVEQTWLQEDSTAQDKSQIQDMYKTYSSPVYDSAPPYMQQDMMFPYQAGLEFVQSLYDNGGWNAVNAAFRNPPVSTSQILHPDRYPATTPVDVSLPDLASALPSGWRKVDENSFGEWYHYLWLSYGDNKKARMPVSLSRQATQNWAGDRYAVYADDAAGQTAGVLVSDWGTQTNANLFRDGYEQYGIARWGTPQTQGGWLVWKTDSGPVEITVKDARTTWISAPDATALAKIKTGLGFK